MNISVSDKLDGVLAKLTTKKEGLAELRDLRDYSVIAEVPVRKITQLARLYDNYLNGVISDKNKDFDDFIQFVEDKLKQEFGEDIF